MTRSTLSSLYLDSQLEGLEAAGFPRARALKGLGLDDAQLDDPRFRLPVSELARLFGKASSELDNPHLGLEVGANFRVSSFAKSGRMYAFCDTLRDVVRMNGRYQRLAIDAGEISLLEDGGTYLSFLPYESEGEGNRHVIESIFASYGTAFQWLSWAAGKSNKSVTFAHPLRGNAAHYERVLQCPVGFGASHNSLEFDPDVVDVKLPTADPERLSMVRMQLDRLLETSALKTNETEDAVRAAIRSCLRGGEATLSCVAEGVGRTERQLRTELKRVGTSFRSLLDDVRKEVYQHERSRGRSLAAIAQALGYNDQSAFNRAYKRWYGTSPREHESLTSV